MKGRGGNGAMRKMDGRGWDIMGRVGSRIIERRIIDGLSSMR
jgi:hypothetical protein